MVTFVTFPAVVRLSLASSGGCGASAPLHACLCVVPVTVNRAFGLFLGCLFVQALWETGEASVTSRSRSRFPVPGLALPSPVPVSVPVPRFTTPFPVPVLSSFAAGLYHFPTYSFRSCRCGMVTGDDPPAFFFLLVCSGRGGTGTRQTCQQ